MKLSFSLTKSILNFANCFLYEESSRHYRRRRFFGKTADFEFRPPKAGVYELKVTRGNGKYKTQKWIVHD